MDAGTDNGFTFTSPNWPTEPQAAIFRITNTIPAHPAGSFNYPDRKSLPTIATFTFIKEKEYELSEVFNIEIETHTVKNKYSYEVENNEEKDGAIIDFVLTTEKIIKKEDDKKNENEVIKKEKLNNEIPDIDLDKDTKLLSAVKMSKKASKKKSKSFRSGYLSSSGPTDFMKKKYQSPILKV